MCDKNLINRAFYFVILGLLLLTLSSATAADVVAQLDRTQAVEGEPVVLTLSTSGDVGGNPDFSPLQQDFDLVRQGQSNRMSFVNGRSSSSREWHLTLMPRRTGTIAIPPITLGNRQSQALTLEVLPAAQAVQQGVALPVMLEAEVEPTQPYVQQQTIYTVRLLHAVPLSSASLSDPRADNALVKPLGDARRYETYRDGKVYRVIERRYAVVPQRSGALRIDGPVLTGRVPDNSQPGNSLRDRFFGTDPFAGFGSLVGATRPIQVRTPEKTLDVKPQPPATPQPWLPAESLSLEQQWSKDPQQLRAGEPVTRTVVIRARGLTDEQLPEPDLAIGPDASHYPDQPRGETRIDGDNLVAEKILSAAIVPARAGGLEIPALEVGWWDVKAGEARVARLPAMRLDVAPGPVANDASNTQPAPAPHVAGNVPGQPPASAGGERAADPVSSAEVEESGSYWPWLTLAFALAWLGSLLAWWRTRAGAARPASRQGTAARAVPDTRTQAPKAPRLDALQRTFESNDARSARRELLAWAEARWPVMARAQTLDALAGRLGRPAAKVLSAMDAAAYGRSDEDWDGNAAWQALAPLLRQADARSTRGDGNAGSALPPLYPESP
jgi:hypothetical protein